MLALVSECTLSAVAQAKDNRELFGGGGRGERQEPASRRDNAPEELLREIESVERALDELRASYELYFMGIDRAEPVQNRDKVKGRLRRLKDIKATNTAAKFRIQQLGARMISLETHWKRTLRQKESGTYARDLAKLKRKKALLEPAQPKPIDPKDTKQAPTRSSSRPRASSVADLTDDKLRRIYDTFVGARKRCGETSHMSFSDMSQALRKQVPQLLQSSGAKSVEFKVVIRGGKAVLKALPNDK